MKIQYSTFTKDGWEGPKAQRPHGRMDLTYGDIHVEAVTR